MKKFKALLEKPWFAYTFAAVCAVLVYLFFTGFKSIKGFTDSVMTFLSPIITGIIIAYLLNPVSEFFKRTIFKKVKKEGAKHILGVTLTCICVLLVLGIIIGSLIPSLVQSISKLISSWDSYTAKIQELLEKLTVFLESKKINFDLSNVSSLVNDSMDKLVKFIKDNSKNILSVAGSIGSGISNFAIGVLFGVCFLVAKKTILSVVKKLLSAFVKYDTIDKYDDLFFRCSSVFISYVGATLVDALIIGIGALIFMLIMGMPYAPLIAVVVAATNIIPTIGPMIGSAIGIFFLVLDKPLNALWFFIFMCVWQTIDGMIIKPKLFNNSLGIPAVWTLFLIAFGGKIGGMTGIILSIPAGAILIIIYNETIVPKLEKRKKLINGITETEEAEEPPEETEEQ